MSKLIKENKRNVRNSKKKSSKQKGKRNSPPSKQLKRVSAEKINVDLPLPDADGLEKFFPSKYNVSLRTLNAFIIYRKVISAEIKKKYNLCWSNISTIASEKWSLENDQVKQHYRELAEKTKALYRSKHLFYVQQGKNAAGSVMLQDNGETVENTPKTYTFVYSGFEKNSSNDSINEVSEQQKNAFSEDDLEISESFNNNINSRILPNENEQNINNTLNNFFNVINFTDFLNDDSPFPQFQFGEVNENISGFDARGLHFRSNL